MKNKKGFTLVELVIVIIIVGILSIVGVITYQGYVQRAMETEGVALMGTIARAEDIYYAEYGEYYYGPTLEFRTIDDNIGIDCSGNKYFTEFCWHGTYLRTRTVKKIKHTTFRMRFVNSAPRKIEVSYASNANADSWQDYK